MWNCSFWGPLVTPCQRSHAPDVVANGPALPNYPLPLPPSPLPATPLHPPTPPHPYLVRLIFPFFFYPSVHEHTLVPGPLQKKENKATHTLILAMCLILFCLWEQYCLCSVLLLINGCRGETPNLQKRISSTFLPVASFFVLLDYNDDDATCV